MATLQNTFNSGTNGTAISTANSGGVNGDAFNVATGATFDSGNPHSGGFSALCFSDTVCNLTWNISATQIWTRHYVRMTSVSAHTMLLLWSGAGATGTSTGRILLLANGTLQIGSAVATLATLSVAASTGQYVRLEGRWSTTSGCDLRLFNSPDSDTPSGTATLASNIGSSVASVQIARASATGFLYWDDFAVSTEGWLGPAVDVVPRSPAIVPSAAHRASRW